ncbi:transcription factor a mitochondrial [Echinococcus multilocularis]|uniref:Transcription factor a mitochondrial n=1 Tax=Echinococcus multilocularis TaxID=6211 RepID=A0A087W0H2_ECHMU|nr:transcription factor a mitochondrial [Echinococcus multilocularis]
MEKMACGFSVLRLGNPLRCCGRFVAVESRKPPAFSAYVKAYFNDVKSKNPIMKTTEIMKKLSEMYKAASPADLVKLTLNAPITKTKTDEEKLEDRKKLLFARKHGLPKPLPTTGYKVYICEQLSGNKGSSLQSMTSKLSAASKSWSDLSERNKEAYISRALENRLAHLRNLKTWSEEKGIQFSKRSSVLASRFYAKHYGKDTTGKSASIKSPPK